MQNAAALDWGLIMSTLVIRFIGVFVVLIVLMLGMTILGKIVSSMVARQEAREAQGQEDDPPAIALAEEPEREVGEEELVAAIGAAIAMAIEAEGKIVAPTAQQGTPAGSWAVAGRTTQMSARLHGGAHRRS